MCRYFAGMYSLSLLIEYLSIYYYSTTGKTLSINRFLLGIEMLLRILSNYRSGIFEYADKARIAASSASDKFRSANTNSRASLRKVDGREIA